MMNANGEFVAQTGLTETISDVLLVQSRHFDDIHDTVLFRLSQRLYLVDNAVHCLWLLQFYFGFLDV